MKSFIILIIYIYNIYSKNLLFPFKKMTIEYLNESKSINDFMNYNIYTNISVGSPPRKIAHFITNRNKLFSKEPLELHYHSDQRSKNIQKEIEKSLDIFYHKENSSSFETIDNFFYLFSDLHYFYDLDKNVYNQRLEFNMVYHWYNNLCGIIDLLKGNDGYSKKTIYTFPELKKNELIDGYYFTFIYEKNYIYLDDDYSKLLGNLIIGEAPHEFNPDLYSKDDEIKINGDFSLYIDEIKFKNSKNDYYIEKEITITINFNYGFIRGSKDYQYEIESIFFNELMATNLCKSEYIDDSIVFCENIVFSCVNNDIVKEKITHFPTLYFEIKQYGLTFLFNYQELFQLHNDRLYFLILFRKTNVKGWDVGELFLRKYITAFNYDSKTISFYKKQVDNINSITDMDIEPIDSGDYITDSPSKDSSIHEDSDDSKNASTGNNDKAFVIRIIIEIIMGIVIVSFIAIFIIKYRNSKKKRANELKDDDYEYIPEEKIIN